jgi:hypothetical protein
MIFLKKGYTMIQKLIFSIFFLAGVANAGLVNGVALVINDQPITLYDIDEEMQKKNIDKNSAVQNLINGIIYEQALKNNSVSVDIFDVDNYIAKLAAQNNMKPLEFKALVRQQQDYNQFIQKIKEQLTHQKLIRKVAGGNLKIATEDDLKIYYENNKDQFSVPKTIEVTAYVSKNKNALEQISSNPMSAHNDVMTQDITFAYDEINPQVRYILQNTEEKTFSVVFPQERNYNMFFIKEKKDVSVLPFEQVKEKIFQVIMEQREKNYLNEYFETQKLTSNIKIYR